MLKFRTLRADEVDCRVSTCKEGGLSLLLYKDARCDMNILDETVGPERWQRHHSRDNANCTVSIYIPEMDQWVEKEDTGTESNTEAEKGLASDSFKRACFNWGVGRELYTAPFIWITSAKCSIGKGNNGKPACYDRFRVGEMTVEDGKITSLTILNDSRNGEEVYRWAKQARRGPQEPLRATEAQKTDNPTPKKENAAESLTDASLANKLDETQVNLLRIVMEQIGQKEGPMLSHYNVARLEDMTQEQYGEAMNMIRAYKDKRRKK